MTEPINSWSDHIKEGAFDICKRMADVEAGRRDRYGGMPQQPLDAEDRRRRLRKKTQKRKERDYKKSLDDEAGGVEHSGNKSADKVVECGKVETITKDLKINIDKATEKNDMLRKDKAVDENIGHGFGKPQKQLQDHRKSALRDRKTLKKRKGDSQQVPESSSDEELQWATDRIMLGDLDEVPVGLEQPKTKSINSSTAAEQPQLRLRGGALGAGRRHKPQDYYSEDDHSDDHHSDDHHSDDNERDSFHEEGRNYVRDRSHNEKKSVRFDETAEEPHQNLSPNKNSRDCSSTKTGFGSGARAPPFIGLNFRGESKQPGGRNGLGFGPSTRTNFSKQGPGLGFSGGAPIGGSWSSTKTGEKRGAGLKYEFVDLSDEGSDLRNPSHKKGKGKSRGGKWTRSPSPSPTRSRNHGSHRGKSGKRSSRAAQFEGSSSSDEEDSDSDSDRSTMKSQGRRRGERRTRSPPPRPTRTRNRGPHRGGARKGTSRAAQHEYSSSSNYEDSSGFDEDFNGSTQTGDALENPPPDHYGVLGLSPACSAQEIKEAAKTMRIKTHPDRLKKDHMSSEEKAKIDEIAANVGQAAELLLDQDMRREYDRALRIWQIKNGKHR